MDEQKAHRDHFRDEERSVGSSRPFIPPSQMDNVAMQRISASDVLAGVIDKQERQVRALRLLQEIVSRARLSGLEEELLWSMFVEWK